MQLSENQKIDFRNKMKELVRSAEKTLLEDLEKSFDFQLDEVHTTSGYTLVKDVFDAWCVKREFSARKSNKEACKRSKYIASKL